MQVTQYVIIFFTTLTIGSQAIIYRASFITKSEQNQIDRLVKRARGRGNESERDSLRTPLLRISSSSSSLSSSSPSGTRYANSQQLLAQTSAPTNPPRSSRSSPIRYLSPDPGERPSHRQSSLSSLGQGRAQLSSQIKPVHASIEMNVPHGHPTTGFTKTPETGKVYHWPTPDEWQLKGTSHFRKASAGGHSTPGAHIQATASGKRVGVRFDLKAGGTGYVQPFYDNEPHEMEQFTHLTAPPKLNLPPDKSGKSMGVVAGVTGPGFVKAKAWNEETSS